MSTNSMVPVSSASERRVIQNEPPLSYLFDREPHQIDPLKYNQLQSFWSKRLPVANDLHLQFKDWNTVATKVFKLLGLKPYDITGEKKRYGKLEKCAHDFLAFLASAQLLAAQAHYELADAYFVAAIYKLFLVDRSLSWMGVHPLLAKPEAEEVARLLISEFYDRFEVNGTVSEKQNLLNYYREYVIGEQSEARILTALNNFSDKNDFFFRRIFISILPAMVFGIIASIIVKGVMPGMDGRNFHEISRLGFSIITAVLTFYGLEIGISNNFSLMIPGTLNKFVKKIEEHYESCSNILETESTFKGLPHGLGQ